MAFFDKVRGKDVTKAAEELMFFDPALALEGYFTDSCAMQEAAAELKARDSMQKDHVMIQEDRDGSRRIESFDSFYDNLTLHMEEAQCVLAPDRFLSLFCSCKQNDRQQENHLCGHQLALIAKLWRYLDDHAEKDATDNAAEIFFRELERSEKDLEKEEKDKYRQPDERKKDVFLTPRIAVDKGQPQLTFKISCGTSGRQYICRNLEGMIRTWKEEGSYPLSKTEFIDFSGHDFAETAVVWSDFIRRRIADVRDVNSEVARKSYRYVPAISVASRQELTGSLLDYFYDAAEGAECEYQDKANDVKGCMIQVGHADVHFSLNIDRIADAHDVFAGIRVSGNIPRLIQGGSSRYIFNHASLSRISAKEEKMLKPFFDTADEDGRFSFRVGLSRFREFYYRVLPKLEENSSVDVMDQCQEEARKYLPPEPVFVFRIDCDAGRLICRSTVSYDGRESALTKSEAENQEYHDAVQEKRVRKTLHQYFSFYRPDLGWVRPDVTDDILYDFLQEGIPALENFGEVRGTDFFRRQKVVAIPPMHVGISVESGIMDISVTSKDADPEELLQVLESHHLKKKYYRLKSGDFVNLSDDEGLLDVNAFMNSMDLLTADAIHQKIHLPLYRALYLENMLEKHESVAAMRDRTYRALIRGFNTIRNAEYEVPSSLDEIMRPYQAYGFKWLRTLEEAGFGGILADEMGLGKTLEMISVLLSDKERGIRQPSLIVCPASVVYNWVEEFHNFAPSLLACAVAGTQAARRKILYMLTENAPETQEKCADVYVTSYDLLKRDIVFYESLYWNCCILDEAQFIKNQKAAVSKSVKILQSRHRFALTGTPIENRLSELWSIFDFLMPGFLYKQSEFQNRFEVPITKNKDEDAIKKLKSMVSPFMLRRQKKDVLKDLPEKMEEVRYAHLEGEQQKLYDAQVLHMKKMLGNSGNAGEDKIKILAELTKIRQICCDPSLLFADCHAESAKREAFMDLVKSAVDGGHRMLVFSQFTSMLTLLADDLKLNEIEFYEITGSTPKQERMSLVHRFNEGTVPVFLISLKAGGTGLNLTGADVVIHYDPWWNLAAQSQATDRAHRIGQLHQVTVYRMIMKGTIEEKILELQESKKELADAILEGAGESLMNLSSEELLRLLD